MVNVTLSGMQIAYRFWQGNVATPAALNDETCDERNDRIQPKLLPKLLGASVNAQQYVDRDLLVTTRFPCRTFPRQTESRLLRRMHRLVQLFASSESIS